MLLQMVLFHSFLWLSNIPLGFPGSSAAQESTCNAIQYFIVYMHHIFFIYSTVDGHLGCFHLLPTVNSKTVFHDM